MNCMVFLKFKRITPCSVNPILINTVSNGWSMAKILDMDKDTFYIYGK